jgi:CHAD domain-containing protein
VDEPRLRSDGGPRRVDPLERMRRRLLVHRARLGTLLEELAGGVASPEDLHDWHRELKRIRIDGRLWVQLTPRGRAAGYAATDDALRRLARTIGAARNRDVSLELLGHLSRARRPILEEADARPLAEGLARAARSARATAAGLVAGSAGPDLLTAFDRPLRAALPRAAIPRLEAAIDDALLVRLARLERTLGRAYRRPSIPRLHRLRIALRAVRYVDQTRRAVLGAPALPISPALRALQVDLGRLHDVEVLRESAWSLLGGARRSRVDRALGKERRDGKRRLVRRLGRGAVRRDWEHLLAASPG